MLPGSEDCHHEEGFSPTRDLLFARSASQIERKADPSLRS